MKKIVIKITCLVLALVLFAACGAAAPAPADPAAPAAPAAPGAAAPAPAAPAPAAAAPEGMTAVPGGTLIVGNHIIDAQLVAKNPFLPANTAESLLPFMYEGLLFFNAISGELEPSLATGYEWRNDYRELVFNIRQGVTWHDGQPFGVDDVLFTWHTLRDYPVLDRFGLWNHLNDVRAEGNDVILELSTTFPSMPFYTDGMWIVPRHIWAYVPDIVAELNEIPVGTGPFIWSHYTIGTDVQFEANVNYWRGAPYIERLVVNLFSAAPAATLALIAGDIQATLGTIAMPMVPEFMQQTNARIQFAPGLGNWAVMINHENELLADRTVRRAMAMAINQNDLITRVENSIVFPTSPGWLPGIFGDLQSEAAREYLVFDPAGAVELLEEAGFVRGPDNIFSTPDGQRLSFTYHNASGAPAQQMSAGMIQQWLLNIGIEIIPRLATWPELTNLLQTGQFELLQNSIGTPPDPFASLNIFHSSMTAPSGTPTPGLNYFRYRNATVDALLEEAAVTADQNRRRELFIEIQDILAHDAVFLPMFNTGPRVPHYYGTQFAGWIEDAPALSPRGIIEIFQVQQ